MWGWQEGTFGLRHWPHPSGLCPSEELPPPGSLLGPLPCFILLVGKQVGLRSSVSTWESHLQTQFEGSGTESKPLHMAEGWPCLSVGVHHDRKPGNL